MDMINTKTFEIRRSRAVLDKTDWIAYKWTENDAEKKTVIKELNTPDCERKYWKMKTGKIAEMTVEEKAIKDESLIVIPKDFISIMKRIFSKAADKEQEKRFKKMYKEHGAMFELYIKMGELQKALEEVEEVAADPDIDFNQDDAEKIKSELN